ncbi:class I SAM-dependent methyltransferase [Vibrio sp. TH_r3]|uniref:class I SAM-dependent methyltransferase n=1 Tax=Vibrio sp. TH_r3 TaxID=3082084 RepID=UPI00295525EB|nr:class I SAM-dependent methyltransferase [Vibrio sp. TH_r3]MDV7104206.1 class I SAM-dependent methyltransferase [Vibrio sp. TH_r3]
MKYDFYREFEEKNYAPREHIYELRKQYLPFTNILRDIYAESKVFDLGCGRGEWLELMVESDFKAFGVDLNEGMLADCIERELSVKEGDGVEFLTNLPSMSHSVISAFHVVEHLPFDDLLKFISEAERVLLPGGLLILETPNPENIIVGTNNFYFDPTHIKPIPSALLSFLCEHNGFIRNKIMGLNHLKNFDESTPIELYDVLSGVSPDYAIVAQKKASSEILSQFDSQFSLKYGVTLQDISKLYSKRCKKISYELDTLKQQLDYLNQKVDEIYNSRSWKVTKPLRGLSMLLRKVRGNR